MGTGSIVGSVPTLPKDWIQFPATLSLQLPITPAQWDVIPSSGLCENLHSCAHNTYTQTYTHAHTKIRNKNKLFLKVVEALKTEDTNEKEVEILSFSKWQNAVMKTKKVKIKLLTTL